MNHFNKIWVILNPTAGKGKALKKLPRIEKLLRDSNREFEIIKTTGVGHALELARDLKIGADDIIVAAGGDGTINEVINGLLTKPKEAAALAAKPPLFGILPIGRGNDFCATPKIPTDIEKAIPILLNNEPYIIDAGFVKGGFFPDGRYFVNGVGIGFDTKVGFEAAKLKIKSGISYAIGAIILIARYEPSPVLKIKFDDNEETLPAVLVSVVNGRRMGGSFYMGPKALLNDGLLDLCFVHHRASRMELIKIVGHYTKGTQEQCEGVHFYKGKHFHLTALEGGMAAHADGETVCYEGKELEMKVIPGALRLVG